MYGFRQVMEPSGLFVLTGQGNSPYSFGFLIMLKTKQNKTEMRDNAEQGKMRPLEHCFPTFSCFDAQMINTIDSTLG